MLVDIQRCQSLGVVAAMLARARLTMNYQQHRTHQLTYRKTSHNQLLMGGTMINPMIIHDRSRGYAWVPVASMSVVGASTHE